MIKLLPHQKAPSDFILDCFLNIGSSKGKLIMGQTGCGKTFVLADAIRRAQDKGLFQINNEARPFQMHSLMVLAPKNCITQHRRVFAKAGLKNVEVTSGDSLRSSYGECYINWKTVVKHGELEEEPEWDESSMPDCIIIDEVQQYKNWGAQKTKCIAQYLKQGGKVITMSATPFQKASEARLVLAACGLVPPDNFNDYANSVSNGSPTANSPIAIRRIKHDLMEADAIFEIKGVRYPFKPIIKNYLFDLSQVKRVIFLQAYAEYLEERAKAGKSGTPQGIIALWVAQNKFREKAELLRADEIAELAFNICTSQGRQIIIGSNYIPTLRKVWATLIKLGVKPEKISHLIGGMGEKQRQQMIDDFQSGKTDYFLTTLKSGGTGLSLHHELEAARPRTVILPPTWSVYEMIQVLGRAQRINNLSQVEQFICWYKDTIEDKVAQRLESKFACLRELIDRKESFISEVFNGEVSEYEREMFEKEAMTTEDGEIVAPEDKEQTMFTSEMLGLD